MSENRDRVRARLDIVDVVGKRITLKKSGKEFRGLCPFHNDRTPSLHVVPNIGIYKCFACGASGDAFKFVMEFHKIDFLEALKLLAEEVGVELKQEQEGGSTLAPRRTRLDIMKAAQEFFRSQLDANKMALKYCADRDLSPAVIEQWGLGYAPEDASRLPSVLKRAGYNLLDCKELFLVEEDDSGGYYAKFRGRLMIPIYDQMGNLVAYGGRVIGQGNPKYVNSSDTSLYSKRQVLFGLNLAKDAIEKSGRAVLVEGYLDVIACHRSGVLEAVASLGTSLAQEQARVLSRLAKEVVILYDADEAGQKAAERATTILREEGLKVGIANIPDGGDPDTLLRDQGAEAVRQVISGQLSPVEFKVGQLRGQFRNDDPDLWQQIATVLSGVESHVELERVISQLAGSYPFTSDRVAAMQALRRDALKGRRKKVSRRAGISGVPGTVGGLHQYEVELFRGLLHQETMLHAMQALKDLDLLFTKGARDLATECLAHLGEQKKPIASDQWLPDLPEGAIGPMTSIALSEVVPITLPILNAAIAKLVERKRGREIRDSIELGTPSDEELARIREHLVSKSTRDE